MPFTVADFHDLVRLLEEHPDWRTELRRVLFSQGLLDQPHTVQELAVAQRHTEEAIARLTERMEQGFTEAATEGVSWGKTLLALRTKWIGASRKPLRIASAFAPTWPRASPKSLPSSVTCGVISVN
jgi:hypothetical protein